MSTTQAAAGQGGVMKCYITLFGATYDKRLPPLLDSISHCNKDVLVEINGAWFAAKPYGVVGGIYKRIYHAWLVLTGNAVAVQFAEDHFRMAKEDTSHD